MDWLQLYTPNELHLEFLGVNGLNPWDGWDSSSRKQMFSSHIGQTLVVAGATERYCQTGMEREFGKYTFNVKMPRHGQVVRLIDRYVRRADKDDIVFNPQSVLIYQDTESNEFGMVNIPKYCSQHQYFGFPYKEVLPKHRMASREYIKAGEVIMESPSIVPETGGYKYGVEMPIAFMTHPAVSEDGILISKSALQKFRFKTYEQRVVEYGSKRMPLNLYGDDENYKPFPDIGERIRADGILMALRSYDRDLAVVEQSVRDLQEVDAEFDKLTYGAGAGGRIVDIRVYHDAQNSNLPEGMDAQPLKYDRARRSFYDAILSEYNRLRRERKASDGTNGVNLTPEFHRMLVEAISVVGKNTQHPTEQIKKLHRQAPLDDWRIEFTIEYEITPTIGFKLTDCHGGKGVICAIAEDEDMPIDAAGNRAHMVMDPNSTLGRMNVGRAMEQYINAASRDVAKRVQAAFAEISPMLSEREITKQLAVLESKNDARMTEVWAMLRHFYGIVSPVMASWFSDEGMIHEDTGEILRYGASKAEHLARIISHQICYLHMPPNNPPEGEVMIAQLEEHFRPTYGPVTYRGLSGNMVTTRDPVRIGSVYVIILEKIADDWTAVASGKTQHYGVLAQTTNTDKYATPVRQNPIRAWGEAEVRIGVAYCGPRIMAEILDRNNNPATHEAVVRSILRAEKPTHITNAVDRKEIPFGGSKPLQLVKHIAECGGWKFRYQRFNPGYSHEQGARQ